MAENEQEAPQAEQQETITDRRAQEFSHYAQTFQKLADRTQKGYRDETNPVQLRWRLYGSSEAYSLVAAILREATLRVSLGNPPPNDIGILEQIYKSFLEMAKQGE